MAAAKIQAGFRGYKVRSQYSDKKQQAKGARDDANQQSQPPTSRKDDDDEIRRKEKAASVIQASYQGHKVRASLAEKQVREHEKLERQNKAASKIQGRYRGYMVRKEYAGRRGQKVEVVKDVNDNEKKDEQNDRDMRDKAASKIQSRYKGFRTRKQYKALKAKKSIDNEQSNDAKSYAERERAASKIQAGFRGHQVRKSYTSKKADRNSMVKQVEEKEKEKQNEAASKIQANFKGYRERRRYQERKQQKVEKEQAASKIQASFMGYKTRKEISENKKAQLPDQPKPSEGKASDLDKAAATIQSRYRGYRVRKQYNTKVILESEAESDVDQLPESAHTRQHVKKSQITLGKKGNMATIIQNCCRAHHFRKTFFDNYNESVFDLQGEENYKVQAVFKGFFARKLAEEYLAKSEHNLLQEKAATTIQSHYRGFKARKTKCYSFKQVNKIQAAFRAHITRKLNKVHTVKLDIGLVEGADYHASLIQSLCKGYMTRHSISLKARPIKSGHSMQGPTKSNEEISFWEDSNIKMYSDSTLRQAATQIQSAYYAYIVRNSYVLIREKIQDKQTKAAVSIQAWFRGCQIRKRRKELELKKNMKDDSHDVCVEKSGKEERGGDKVCENRQKNEHDVASETNNDHVETLEIIEDQEWDKKELQINEKNKRKEESISRPSSGRKRRAQSRTKSMDQTPTPNVEIAYNATIENESSASRSSTSKDRQSVGSPQTPHYRENMRPITGLKRDHSGRFKALSKHGDDSEIKIDKGYENNEFLKENSKHSSETDKTLDTLKSKESEKSFGCEVEKEGESPREIEDDASELSKIRKNSIAVGQIQAAFKAYKLRREVSELLSGGGELMDIKSVDRAVSALRKDFKLRSAKVRRLASYQFSKRPKATDWWNADTEDDIVKTISANTVQAAFRSLHSRKASLKSSLNHVEKEREQPGNWTKTEKNCNEENVIEKHRSKDTKSKIEAAYRGYRTRKTEQTIKAKPKSDICFHKNTNSDEKKIKVETLEQIEKKETVVRNQSQNVNDETNSKQDSAQCIEVSDQQLKAASEKIEAAFRGYRTRETERKLKNKQISGSHSHDKNLTKDEEIRSRVIELSVKGYVANRQEENEKLHKESASKIAAAFQGYSTRKKIGFRRVKDESRSIMSSSSRRSFHVEMHSMAISNRATLLQAAFAAYQTRKVFISLTKIVEQDSFADTSSYNLERMGSLSETDDFKLRHKSIAKIQALEAERLQINNHLAKNKNSSHREKDSGMLCTIHLPLQGMRPKSGLCLKSRSVQTIDVKSKTQPELKRGLTSSKSKDKLHGIEIFVKKKIAATVIQSHAKGFIVRQKYKGKSDKVCKKSENSVSQSRKSITPSSKNSSRSKDDKHNPDWVKTEIRARTASIKLEAEKRKLIAQQVKQKKARETGEDVCSSTNKHVEHEEPNDNDSKGKLDRELTPILSERRVTSHGERDKEINSAIKIQKVYRGYAVRKSLKAQLKNTAELEDEYEKWKTKRIHAAVAIQSIWRGYMVRKELQKEQEEQANMIQDPFWNCDSPPDMLVINIGRTKSEIERANQRYKRCSMIQMVVKASKVRRKMQVKMAKRRGKKMISANIIHAAVQGYMRRKKRKCLKCANHIQTIAKGFLAREHIQERIRMRLEAQQKAATTLQAVYKGYIKRKDNADQKESQRKLAEAHQSALHIQSAVRGYTVREDLEESKVIMQKEAAIKIQAGIAGYKERTKMKERKLAATKLTAAYKSYKRRQDLKVYKEKMENERIASTRLQAAYRAYKRRVARRLYVEKKERDRLAATALQSGYKGYIKRFEMRALKEKKARQNKAMAIVQSSASGHLARVKYQLLKQLHQDREKATLKIQSIYRGHRDRLSVNKLKHMVEVNTVAKDIIELLIDRAHNYIQQRQDSAERIQATVKGYATRSKLNTERQARLEQRNYFASRIQAVVRAEQGRVWNEQWKEMAMKNNAATKIQSLYRGHFVRKQIEKEKSMIAELEPPFISARTRSGRLLALSLDDVLMKNARAMILFHKKASELQAAFRAYKMRQTIRDRLNIKQKIMDMTPRREKSKLVSHEDKAAVVIQKTWRGYSDRKAYKRLITVKRKLWNTLASVIHAAVRGYERRKSARRKKERRQKEGSELIRRKRREAADIIAYAFRALQKRNEKVALRVEM